MRKRRSAEGSVSSAARRCVERRAGFFIYSVAAVNTAPAQVRTVSQTFLYIFKIKSNQPFLNLYYYCFFLFFFYSTCLVLFANGFYKRLYVNIYPIFFINGMSRNIF